MTTTPSTTTSVSNGSYVVACLDPDTARHLFLSSLLVGMAYEEGITPNESDRACQQVGLSGIDVAELAANDETSGHQMVVKHDALSSPRHDSSPT